jgi:hypothetical protein
MHFAEYYLALNSQEYIVSDRPLRIHINDYTHNIEQQPLTQILYSLIKSGIYLK